MQQCPNHRYYLESPEHHKAGILSLKMQANLLQLIQGWSLSLCSWRHQYSTSVLLNLQWTCLKRLFQSPSFISWFKLNIHCTYFPNPIFKCHLILRINFKYCKTDRISWAACSVLRRKTSNWMVNPGNTASSWGKLHAEWLIPAS